MTENSIAQLKNNLNNAEAAIVSLRSKHKESLRSLESARDRASYEYKLVLNHSLNLEWIKNAESIITIRGQIGITKDGKVGLGNDLEAVEDAIKWFAGSGGIYLDLNCQYSGCKNYDGYIHQRENHNYGFGPRHGNIVFAIELKPEFRKKDLTDEQKSNCIYYLEALKIGQLERDGGR